MIVNRLEVYHVGLALHTPFRTAYGEDTTIESVLVRLIDEEGVIGWAESCPLTKPTYSPEWAGGVFATITEHFAPALIGRNLETGQGLQQALARYKGNYFAKAALDMAWWDADSTHHRKPLWKHIGGTDDTARVGADFGVTDSIDQLLDQIAGALEAGFDRIKLKFRPGWDVEMVRAVRAAFPQATYHIDCNAAYSLEDTPMFEALDDLGLAMIEQPLAAGDLHDHAHLARRIATPICLDESIQSIRSARQAIDLGACRWINLKPGRVGGITPARTIHEMARQAGIPCWVGGMLESGVGASHCLALATLPNCRAYGSDIFPSTRFYEQDLAEPEVILDGPGRIRALETPGCGRAPNSDRLVKQTIHKAVFDAG